MALRLLVGGYYSLLTNRHERSVIVADSIKRLSLQLSTVLHVEDIDLGLGLAIFALRASQTSLHTRQPFDLTLDSCTHVVLHSLGHALALLILYHMRHVLIFKGRNLFDRLYLTGAIRSVRQLLSKHWFVDFARPVEAPHVSLNLTHHEHLFVFSLTREWVARYCSHLGVAILVEAERGEAAARISRNNFLRDRRRIKVVDLGQRAHRPTDTTTMNSLLMRALL